jgi:hypothetical protein
MLLYPLTYSSPRVAVERAKFRHFPVGCYQLSKRRQYLLSQTLAMDTASFRYAPSTSVSAFGVC